MRGKRISDLKKQKWGVRVYRFRNSDKHHSVNWAQNNILINIFSCNESPVRRGGGKIRDADTLAEKLLLGTWKCYSVIKLRVMIHFQILNDNLNTFLKRFSFITKARGKSKSGQMKSSETVFWHISTETVSAEITVAYLNYPTPLFCNYVYLCSLFWHSSICSRVFCFSSHASS